MTDGQLLPVGAALELVLQNACPLPAEEVRLESAVGRYLAAPVVATLDLPPFTNSAMDGFALRHHDAPGRFDVIGESAAGAPFAGSVGPAQAVTISTGAALPDGADAVAPIEWVTRDGASSIEVPRQVPHDYSVRHAGSDVRHGTEVLPAGMRVGAAQIGAAAALGVVSLYCGCRPRVAVLTTGSELRPVGERLGPGEIYDSNGPLLRAALASAGAEVTVVPTAADTREAHRDAIERALAYDVVISTGGVSVGGHDLVREVERELGVRELFWRIAMRPGKPLSFGVRGGSPAGQPGGSPAGESGRWPAGQPGGSPASEPPGERHKTLLFGVPGNPVSVLVCFELFVRPALAALQGAHNPRPAFTRAALASTVERNPERDDFIRVRHVGGDRIEPLAGQQSHQLAITALAEGLARIPAGSGALGRGELVDYLPLGVS
jgi:molybdopterin molybdotransferase